MVLVDGQRVVGVDSVGAPIPEHARLLDLADATVLPGLINVHVHLCGDSANGALERLPEFSDEHLASVGSTRRCGSNSRRA